MASDEDKLQRESVLPSHSGLYRTRIGCMQGWEVIKYVGGGKDKKMGRRMDEE